MRSIRIFIASSGRAEYLAKQLVELLRSPESETKPRPRRPKGAQLDPHQLRVLLTHPIQPILWSTAFRGAEYTLENLIMQARLADFAAVLLTEDDFTKKKDEKLKTPRDNCVYEAGLFTGALGPNHKRCFLLTSLSFESLPSDLQGLTLIKIKEKGPKSEGSVKEAAIEILKCVVERGPFERPLVKADELIEFESRVTENSVIYVSATEPLERRQDFARRVMANMRRSIEYRYFFHGDPDITKTVAGMVQTLAAVGVEKKKKPRATAPDPEAEAEDESPLARRELMQGDPDVVKDNLEILRKYLSIHFEADEPNFPCCIHDVGGEMPICYLRFPGEGAPNFAKWKTGDGARQVACGLRGETPACRLSTRCIFGFKKFHKKHKKRVAKLRESLTDYLREFFPPNADPSELPVFFEDTKPIVKPMAGKQETGSSSTRRSAGTRGNAKKTKEDKLMANGRKNSDAIL